MIAAHISKVLSTYQGLLTSSIIEVNGLPLPLHIRQLHLGNVELSTRSYLSHNLVHREYLVSLSHLPQRQPSKLLLSNQALDNPFPVVAMH